MLPFLGNLVCVFLAAAASCRARVCGCHFTGAMVIGCICGLTGPFFRELVLNGSAGCAFVLSEMLDDALIGALTGIGFIAVIKREKVFFWLDSISIGLASSFAAILAAPLTGVKAALVLGLASGLTPGLLRDVSLGDTALAIEQDWYAAAAVIGCAFTLFVYILPAFWQLFPKSGELAIICGTLTTVLLRLRKINQ